MNTEISSLKYRFVAGVICFLFLHSLQAQDCFSINIPKSQVILDTPPAKNFPNDGGALEVSCSNTITNFSVVVDFHFNTEKYFEDTIQMVATLMHKGSTYIMVYDRMANTFSLLGNPPNLEAGSYLFTVTATNCLPAGSPCDNCTISHSFDILNKPGTNLNVLLSSTPILPILSCFPNSSVTLNGSIPQRSNIKMQWARLVNNEYIKIIGATSNTFTATQPGTYQYTQTSPNGCTGSNMITVSPPQLPGVAIQPDTQKLNSCTQEIKGVQVTNTGGIPDNIQYAWAASNGGVIKSSENTPNPVISTPGIYTLIISRKDNGCTATAAATVTLGNIQIVTAAVSKDREQLDCRTSAITLSASANLSSGSSGFTFNWSTGADNPDIQVNSPGIYTVTATAALNGCQGAVSTTIVKDISKPILIIQSPRDTLCAGESVNLIATAPEAGEYKWSDNTAGNLYIATPAADGDNVYTVTVTAADNGCTNSATRTLTRVPVPAVTCFDLSVTVENGNRQSLDCNAGADELIWVTTPVNVRDMPPLGSGTVQDQLFTLVEGRTPGTVLYFFYARNAGCTSDRADVLVQVLPKTAGGIFVPELITPNGDGMNDTWDIVLPDDIQNPEAYPITLFSRNGAKVYSGTLAGSFHAYEYPDGVYYYVITKPDGDTINGAVTILRRE